MSDPTSPCDDRTPQISALRAEALRLAETLLGPEPEDYGSLASDAWYERLAAAAERVARLARWDLALLEEATPSEAPELPLNEPARPETGAFEVLLCAQRVAGRHEDPPSFDDEAADLAFLAVFGVIELRIGSTTEGQLLRRIRKALRSRDALARRAVELMPDVVGGDRAGHLRRDFLDALVGPDALARHSSQLVFDAVVLLDEALQAPAG